MIGKRRAYHEASECAVVLVGRPCMLSVGERSENGQRRWNEMLIFRAGREEMDRGRFNESLGVFGRREVFPQYI